MTKESIFDFLSSTAGVEYRNEKVFKESFPKAYAEYESTEFTESIVNLPFERKLWHFLKNVDYIPVCKGCGKPVVFIAGDKWGYPEYCSDECGAERNETELFTYPKISPIRELIGRIQGVGKKSGPDDMFEKYLCMMGFPFERHHGRWDFFIPELDICVWMTSIHGMGCGDVVSGTDGLNFVEIESDNPDGCVKEFENYLTGMFVDCCLRHELPGNFKWPGEHPIWDGHVGNRKSPRDAWNDRECLEKAVKNIFYMCKREDDLRVRHVSEMMKCEISGNRIVHMNPKFMGLIMNRFTIAKIAPKVTALSGFEVNRLIDESGIDISHGVYVPMSGFGGIIDGCHRWGKEHGVEIECECYDINENLCEWYGWKRRDILENVIYTDKVCICCPPFGKNYEHWKGTPREMSDIGFKEWYGLIKKHVIAPEYLIIGPEVDMTGTGSNKGFDSKGNRRSGLFTKKSGVMVWNDETVCYL